MADDPPAAGSPALAFAAAARALTAAARQLSLVPPTFRTPPRLVGVDRSVRRRATGSGGTVSVRLRDRPWAAVLADMIDGVVAVNGLTGHHGGRARADLWDAVTERDRRDRYVA